jgi:NhaP-type Na+/H+ or K+/H+ antiporter
MRNCVRVARQTLTLFVRVRILLPQPRRNRLCSVPIFYCPKGLFLSLFSFYERVCQWSFFYYLFVSQKSLTFSYLSDIILNEWGMKFSPGTAETAYFGLMTSAFIQKEKRADNFCIKTEVSALFVFIKEDFMLTSLALIFLFGLLFSELFKKLHLPGLLGMLLTGILLGPYALNLLDGSILTISADLRQVALIIILMRAGLSLDIKDLKRVGRPSVLMCFVPACFELIGMILLAPKLLGISVLEAAVMGAVVAAVSPAVIVPKMLYLMEHRYGTDKSIPQLILAGASVDDVFVIVLFTAFTALAQGQSLSPASFAQIPVSIVTGLLVGVGVGIVMAFAFQNIHLRDSIKGILLLSISFLFITMENSLKGIVPFSGLLAVMSMGAALQRKRTEVAERLSGKFSKLWVGAEILLFVLVGATVDLKYAVSAGLAAICVICGVLLFRMLGVLVCLIRTKLSMKERVFCMIAYLPKATVQAAIGSVPLSMGLPCGAIVLTVAVLAILITAPLGAFGIDMTYRRLLKKE